MNRETPPTPAKASIDWQSLVVFAFFFCSGALALVYEVAWIRALTLEFGSTTLAVSTVLVVFMGGLAAGSYQAARHADAMDKPMLTYGKIEILLALYALITPLLLNWVLPLFSGFCARFADATWLVSLWRFVAALIFLIGPAFLMGMTLPVLSRFYAMRARDSGRDAGILYGVNTTGAFIGVMSAGFFLLPRLGLRATVTAAALCNLALGISACAMGLRQTTPTIQAPASDKQNTNDSPDSARLLSIAVALTGAAAMICEVTWTRVLILSIGGSVYAFTIVLATFLAGLGLGGWVVAAYVSTTPRKARLLFSILSAAAACLVCLSSSMFPQLPLLFVRLFDFLHLNRFPSRLFWMQAVMAATVMLLPGLVMGALLPVAVRAVVTDPCRVGERVGRLYAHNTVGCIVGSAAAGFLLIPIAGIRGTLLIAAGAQIVSAALSAARRGHHRLNGTLAIFSIILVACLIKLTPRWHEQLMASGMFKYAAAFTSETRKTLEPRLKREEELLFYKDGLTATVTVSRNLKSSDGALYIATNGKTDGSTQSDMANQRLLAHLPMLLHPDPKTICVIGLGTGCTSGSATLYPGVKVTTIEIEAAMVEGARLFAADNHSVHANSDIRVTDGRLYLKLHPKSFDVIISEPSNPWLSGCSDLFTRESFDIGARALRPGGIFAQWMHLYGMSTVNLQVLINTFRSVFPYVYISSPIPNSDLVLLGSQDPFTPDPTSIAMRLEQNAMLRKDLADERVEVGSVYDFLARIRMGPDTVRNMPLPTTMHTDDLPIIAYRGPYDLYRETRGANMQFLSFYATGTAPYLPNADAAFLDGLAAAYEQFIPGGGEALTARRMADERRQ